jgi:antitoxin YefM
MPLKLTMAEARRRLARLPDEMTQGSRTDVAIITDNDEPVLAILPWDFYDGLMETLEILGDPEQMALLQSGLCDMAEGNTESWESAKARLALR